MRRGWKLAAVAATSAALGLAALTTAGSAHDADDDSMGMMRGGGMGMMHDGGMGMMGKGGMGMMGGGMGMGRGMHMFEMLDTNKDGSVDADEAKAAMSEQLKQFDADGNGDLSLDEFAEMWAAQMRPMMVRRFQFHDADGDGKVTRGEMTAPFDRMLRMMDGNGDGKLGPDDMRRGMGDQNDQRGRHRN